MSFTPACSVHHPLFLFVPKLVKAALSLALFGGRQKHTDKNSVPVRGDPHILMVGDPGLGKSQMLQVTKKTHWTPSNGALFLFLL